MPATAYAPSASPWVDRYRERFCNPPPATVFAIADPVAEQSGRDRIEVALILYNAVARPGDPEAYGDLSLEDWCLVSRLAGTGRESVRVPDRHLSCAIQKQAWRRVVA